MTINPASYAVLNATLKDNYLKYEAVLQQPNSELIRMLREDTKFEVDAGGKDMTFALIMDRPHNYGPGSERGYFPGMNPSMTNDDIDTITPDNAVIDRKYTYASTAVTLRNLSNNDTPFQQFKKMNLGFHLDQMKEDYESYLERQLLGDGTDILGVVVSISVSGGNTTIVLQPCTTVSSHGVHGTQRLNKNQKVSFIKAADWATSRRTAKIHSNLGGLGITVFKVVSVSATHDVTSAPSITVGGDLSGGTALAAGDIVVQGQSRTAAAAGGNASDDSGLLAFDGIYSYVDDGTLRSDLYGLTRSTYPDLNSEVDDVADGAATRPLTWRMMQTMADRLRRRAGNRGLNEMDYMLLTEASVKTGYVHDEGESAKRYIQEEKMKKLMPGFSDVGVAFLGNDKAIPWLTMNIVPFGHALFLRKSQLKAFWDRKPSLVDEDGLTLRQVAGKPEFSAHLAGYGNFCVLQPWTMGRINGLSGVFSAST